MMREPQPFVLVVSSQPLDATTTLFFGHLQHRMPATIRVVQYGTNAVAASLSEAAAVVLVRGLFEFGDLARCARALHIPLYYFTDDNFIVLRDQGGIGAQFATRYSARAVREGLRHCAGVLLATPALVSYFSEHGLHPHLFLFPPAIDAEVQAAPRASRPSVTVAFFGGRHLHGQVLDIIVPAIRQLARKRPVRLLSVGLSDTIPASEGLVVSQQPYSDSYARGLRELAAQGVDVLVHPVAAGMANNVYKNPHALISALALAAVPVVSNAPPYDALGREAIALVCDDNEASWLNALTRAVTDDRLRTTLAARLATYCADHFSGLPNCRVIDAMLAGYRPRSRAQTLWRRCVARGYQAWNLAGRARTRLKQAAGVKRLTAAA